MSRKETQMKKDKLDELVDNIIAELADGWDETEDTRELTRIRIRFAIQKYAEEARHDLA